MGRDGHCEKSKTKPRGALAREGVDMTKVDKWLRQGAPGIAGHPFSLFFCGAESSGQGKTPTQATLWAPSTGVGGQQGIFALLLMGGIASLPRGLAGD